MLAERGESEARDNVFDLEEEGGMVLHNMSTINLPPINQIGINQENSK